ncbi:flagellar hook-associated protein FlgL [Hydrogenophaga sp. PAMC20947]|uniref:flagellar hook-associated protein FlgL n=1 Tax=Hydrogenophaga sp. PAMC20947 TaxID=2565558 RepID=UPI00109DAA02|nr:flagellar hook-associated protein FlgL [Hydrogenophaga sp. PAMC20947]QCB46789.1 flagellar hook-associated protein 3 [Hydrogenophaga sp. PAMC20947]
MRVATANSYDNTIGNLSKRQSDLVDQQNRISTGKRVLKASDDPVSAVMSEAVQNRYARVESDKRALASSRASLTQAESALGEANELIQDVRTLLVSAGNGSYSDRERADIALQIEGLRERLLGVANQRDSSGRTLFGGLGGSQTPFVEVYGPSGGGDVRFDGQRGQEATGNNTLPQSLDGEAIWMQVPKGNGTFAVDLGAGNTGSVRTDSGKVTSPTALTGQNYNLTFADVGGVMQFSVTNTTTGAPVAGMIGVPYVAGSAIEFDGMSLVVSGAPQDLDSIAVATPTSPTDIFKVMQNAIDALRSTGNGASRTHVIDRAMGEIDASLDRNSQARSQTGAWLNRADATEALLTGRAVAHKTEQSNLEDLDMIQGISDFQNKQTALEVALQSYAKIQNLSLFQYIS